jgi:chromosomal replication initiation ATPase DnaA
MSRAIVEQFDVVLEQLARLRREVEALRAVIDATAVGRVEGPLAAAIAVVCERMVVPRARLVSRLRDSRTAWARMMACWLAHHAGAMPVTAIAAALDRDHSTIGYGLQRVDLRRACDPEFAGRLAAMADQVRALLLPTIERRAA